MNNLDELKRLAQAATPGIWIVSHYDSYDVYAGYQIANLRHRDGEPRRNGEANAAYIAAVSPDVVLALIERCERLTFALQEKHLEAWAHDEYLAVVAIAETAQKRVEELEQLSQTKTTRYVQINEVGNLELWQCEKCSQEYVHDHPNYCPKCGRRIVEFLESAGEG